MEGITNDDIEFELNELRLLVLMECEGGHFHQVKLSPERFKRVSDACIPHSMPQPDDMRADMTMECTHLKGGWELDADEFLGLASIYDDADECDNKE